jgi:hypothetical protein
MAERSMDDHEVLFANGSIKRSGAFVLGDRAHEERSERCRYGIDAKRAEAIYALSVRPRP